MADDLEAQAHQVARALSLLFPGEWDATAYSVGALIEGPGTEVVLRAGAPDTLAMVAMAREVVRLREFEEAITAAASCVSATTSLQAGDIVRIGPAGDPTPGRDVVPGGYALTAEERAEVDRIVWFSGAAGTIEEERVREAVRGYVMGPGAATEPVVEVVGELKG